MNRQLLKILLSWPKAYISYDDLKFELEGTEPSRYGIINRALKEGMIEKIRRGLYHITLPGRRELVNNYELAQVMYTSSFITKESALQYHNAIPEAVYTVTSGTTNKSAQFNTILGVYTYAKLPHKNFYLGVERIEIADGAFLMARPWRAIADLIYLHKKKWQSLADLVEDMRLELDFYAHREELLELCEKYPNERTKTVLKRLI